jgi:glycosyltransferase involved in cell wall biosynthesis
MLVIITTHPIQYQVPLWQALARDGRVPFEVWYLTHHAVTTSHDVEFGKAFAWDLDMLAGYPHRQLKVALGATPTTFLRCRIVEPLESMLQAVGARTVWIQGWQVLAYWQAAWAAKRAGCKVWLRGESNDLVAVPWWKRQIKRMVLGELFRRVDRFLCIGTANRRLYQRFGIPDSLLGHAPYAVDNDRFAAQAAALRPQRAAIRARWGIGDNTCVAMFCGKFIAKKRPQDLVVAARRAGEAGSRLHLLFVGSGGLGNELRRSCRVVFDADENINRSSPVNGERPLASFAGFLNQAEISEAYVAADCLVLPSDYGETWGLVVNEAMASGLPCIISDHCGCAEDLGAIAPNLVFPFADIDALADHLGHVASRQPRATVAPESLANFNFERSVQSVTQIYREQLNSPTGPALDKVAQTTIKSASL